MPPAEGSEGVPAEAAAVPLAWAGGSGGGALGLREPASGTGPAGLPAVCPCDCRYSVLKLAINRARASGFIGAAFAFNIAICHRDSI